MQEEAKTGRAMAVPRHYGLDNGRLTTQQFRVWGSRYHKDELQLFFMSADMQGIIACNNNNMRK